MRHTKLAVAASFALGVSFATTMPTGLLAETLSVISGNTSNAISILPDQKVVIESEPFAEITIANPAITDIMALSDRQIELSGVGTGRTTLTIFGPGGAVLTHVGILVTPDATTLSSNPIMATSGQTVVQMPIQNGQTENAIEVPASGAIVIETDVDFDSLHVADTTPANALALSMNSLYIVGMEPGITNILLKRDGSENETDIQIKVTPNMTGFE